MRYALCSAARCSASMALLGWLAACPAPAPSAGQTGREPPAGPRTAEPAPAPAPTPTPAEPAPTPTPVEPAPTPDASLPPVLAAEGVRPVARTLWQALEAVDAGDADAMARAMIEGGRWFPPGSLEASVSSASDLRRAMSPWSGPEIELGVRRILDLGGDGSIVAQVSVASREAPGAPHELVLLVEASGDRLAAVRQFGDPLGPVRPRTSETEPLALGPVGEVVLEGGAPEPSLADLTRSLMEAVEARNDDAVRALLAEDVVRHDVTARRTRRGRDAWVAGMRETLGETGHVTVDRHHPGARFVVVEGAVFGRAADPSAPAGPPQEHGFADVHRVVDGKIAETWHYVNRRGRPLRVAPRP